jgi:ribosomal protein L29
MTEPVKQPDPVEPTVAQLKAEVDALKAKLAGTVPAAERDELKKQLADVQAELAALKAAAAAPPSKKGFFPKLF